MSIILIGTNHKKAPISVRERLTFREQELQELLAGLIAPPAIIEALILSTCNRTEFVLHSHDIHCCVERIRDIISKRTHMSVEELDPYLYVLTDGDAVGHIFSVASSLDSMVIGEPQILGQVKEAYRMALKCGTAGKVINRIMHQAFRVSKRVRTETDIGKGAVSVAYAAVEMARHIFQSFAQKTVLLIGAGEMIELAARHFRERGAARTLVTNRTMARAEALAQRLGGQAVPFHRLNECLIQADMVLSCTGAQRPIIDVASMKSALKARKNRPIFLIDIAVPRDIDPEVASLDNVFLYDIDDLQRVIDNHKEERLAELAKAQFIVREETQRLSQWFTSSSSEPFVRALVEWAESIRRSELVKTTKKLKGLNQDQLRVIEAMSRSIMKKLLHHPITRIKGIRGSGAPEEYLRLAGELFGITEEWKRNEIDSSPKGGNKGK